MKAERIASLLASGTEIVTSLGMADQLVAISHECDYPAEVLSRPRVTRSRVNDSLPSREIDGQVRAALQSGEALYEIDVDRLTDLAPDVIITQAQCDVCAVNYESVLTMTRQVPALAAAQILALNPTTLEGLFDDIRAAGSVLGVPEEAKRFADRLTNRVEAIGERTQALPHNRRPRVVCLEWIDPLMVAANWMPRLVELAGGICTLTQHGTRSRYTDWADVRAFDPQVVVVMPCGFDLDRSCREAELLGRLAGWSEVSAVRHNRVFAVDANAYFNRSGPRLVDSLELLAYLIDPSLLPDTATARMQVSDAWQRVPATA